MTVLVTGAAGSVGRALLERIPDATALDIDEIDVTDAGNVLGWCRSVRPRLIFHLAGAKHAPDGELDPAHVSRVNIDGTLNVLAAAGTVGAKVILASTCKACDPETAYGASKLIAERATLNAGGVVCRFYNIPESVGNVFRLWESLPADAPIPVTDCWRYFQPMSAAVDLLLRAVDLPSGRYACEPGEPVWMPAVAENLYPDRSLVRIPRRRGDRHREPLAAFSETIHYRDGFVEIVSPHDPVPVAEAVAA